MAIRGNKKRAYEQQLAELSKSVESSSMETDIAQLEINNLKHLIEEEEVKMRKYRVENIRRKHNYLPLIMEVLKCLAESGQLTKLVEKEKEKKKASAKSTTKKPKESK